MKRKKLVKNALKHPELYSAGEISFFKHWLSLKKQSKKAAKIQLKQEANS